MFSSQISQYIPVLMLGLLAVGFAFGMLFVSVKTSERIEDSDFTKVLPKEYLDRTQPEWHFVSTSGSHYSSSHKFRHVHRQLAHLAAWWGQSEAPQAVRQKTAFHFIALWKYSGSDSLADKYLYEIFNKTDPARSQKIFASIKTLEMPLIEQGPSNLVRTVFYPDGTPLSRDRGHFDPKGKFVRDGALQQFHPAYQQGLIIPATNQNPPILSDTNSTLITDDFLP